MTIVSSLFDYLLSKVNAQKILEIDITTAIDSLPYQYPASGTDSRITSDMVVVNSEFGTPSAQISDWTVNTYDGNLTIAGNISGSTILSLYLAKSR